MISSERPIQNFVQVIVFLQPLQKFMDFGLHGLSIIIWQQTELSVLQRQILFLDKHINLVYDQGFQVLLSKLLYKLLFLSPIPVTRLPKAI